MGHPRACAAFAAVAMFGERRHILLPHLLHGPMGIPLGTLIGMRLRRSPIRLIRASARRLEAAGIAIPLEQLEMHALAGGNLERVVEALLLAKSSGVEATLLDLTALDFMDRDPVAAVKAAGAEEEMAFGHYSPGGAETIVGHTADGAAVEAACRVRYRPPLIRSPGRLQHLQERLAVRSAIVVNTARSLRELDARRSEHEAGLLAVAREVLPSVVQVRLEFRAAPSAGP